jgi:hypothetical protein
MTERQPWSVDRLGPAPELVYDSDTAFLLQPNGDAVRTTRLVHFHDHLARSTG